MPHFIIYGAAGYTGRLAASHAKALALPLTVAGRDKLKTESLAQELEVPSRVFGVTDADPEALDAAIGDAAVLLNCAGPYHRTAEPLIRACIRNRVHYLDIAAELDSYRIAERLDEEAKQAGVMLMPGCGGSVALLGCLASHAMGNPSDKAISIDVALHVAGSMSRGSAVSAAENLTTEYLQRVDGKLEPQDAPEQRDFDFGNGKGAVMCFPVTLPDVITLAKLTGVGNIRTFVHVSGDAFPSGNLKALPDGPTEEQRKANPYFAAVAVTGVDGKVRRAVVKTVNGYTFTPNASVEAVKRALDGVYKPGFQTPAGVFGDNFFEEAIPGSVFKKA